MEDLPLGAAAVFPQLRGTRARVQAGSAAEPGDHKFRINLNANFDPDRFRIYSYDGWTQWVFTGKSPMGVNLTSVHPYMCIGQGDTWLAGGPQRVASTLFVWVD